MTAGLNIIPGKVSVKERWLYSLIQQSKYLKNVKTSTFVTYCPQKGSLIDWLDWGIVKHIKFECCSLSFNSLKPKTLKCQYIVHLVAASKNISIPKSVNEITPIYCCNPSWTSQDRSKHQYIHKQKLHKTLSKSRHQIKTLQTTGLKQHQKPQSQLDSKCSIGCSSIMFSVHVYWN